ncbi:MAG: putative toxin-antitoxin system toxin component, PIN family [Pyrinomonadaceae bacterium]
MRVVADTNIIVSGLLWRGNPRLVLEAARDGLIDLYASAVLLDELEEVLSREKNRERLEVRHPFISMQEAPYRSGF